MRGLKIGEHLLEATPCPRRVGVRLDGHLGDTARGVDPRHLGHRLRLKDRAVLLVGEQVGDRLGGDGLFEDTPAALLPRPMVGRLRRLVRSARHVVEPQHRGAQRAGVEVAHDIECSLQRQSIVLGPRLLRHRAEVEEQGRDRRVGAQEGLDCRQPHALRIRVIRAQPRVAHGGNAAVGRPTSERIHRLLRRHERALRPLE